jgi:hypothetical protein
MEHPLCKICYPPRRHKMGEPHQFPGAMLNDGPDPRSSEEIAASRKPPKKSAVREKGVAYVAVDPIDVKELAKPVEDDPAPFAREAAKRVFEKGVVWDGTPTGKVEGCPVCAERKAKKAAAMKRYREKRRK